jgi:hypothetical protein
LARLLCELDEPTALGVIHRRDAAVSERRHHAARPPQRRDRRALQELLNGADTWTV